MLRRRKALGVTGLSLAGLALLLGAGGVEIGRPESAAFYIGLDWFVLGVLTTAALFVPLERAFALRPEQGPFRAGWLTDAQYFFMSHALVQLMSVLVMAPAVAMGDQMAIPAVQHAVQRAPLVIQFLGCLLIADLAQYWVHRAFHAVPWLWRFHAVHHSAQSMDWVAGSRLHLLDVVVTRGLVLLPLLVLGFDTRAVLAYLVLVSFHAVFIHANFAPRARWLERWIAMPRFHHWHHAIEPEARDRNFAVHLPMIDRWFGTQHLPEEDWPKGYGIAGITAPEGYFRQFAWPLRAGAGSRSLKSVRLVNCHRNPILIFQGYFCRNPYRHFILMRGKGWEGVDQKVTDPGTTRIFGARLGDGRGRRQPGGGQAPAQMRQCRRRRREWWCCLRFRN